MQWGLGWQAALAMWAVPVLVTLPLAWWVLGRLPGLPAPAQPATHAPAITPASRPVTPAGWCAGRAPGCCC
jgi:CP family cyanate transporter-like MFS transporter